MGSCISAEGEELPEASEDDINRLKGRNFVPIVACPKRDWQGKNNIQTVYVAEYENGAEITLLFLDEDRINGCLDFTYDTIRRPLFGRSSDIETIILLKDENGELEVDFPGTHSGEQYWTVRNPSHNHAHLKLADFEQRDGCFVLWVNTWNHLLGETNNNPTMEVFYCCTDTQVHYTLRKGSREEVDGRFKGLITSVAEVMTEEKRQKLGKRLF